MAAACALVWHGVLAVTGKAVLTVAPASRSAETAALSAAGQPAGESVGIPTRIMIPSIAVDALIEQVALKKDGSMDVPEHPLDAAWYALGPRPGEAGSAAIDGHVDWLHGATGVFADLHKVKPGDTITVRDEKGVDIPFVVRATRTYDAAADARDVFISSDGKAHLNIITCDGKWDKSAGQYTKRLVVFADEEVK